MKQKLSDYLKNRQKHSPILQAVIMSLNPVERTITCSLKLPKKNSLKTLQSNPTTSPARLHCGAHGNALVIIVLPESACLSQCTAEDIRARFRKPS